MMMMMMMMITDDLSCILWFLPVVAEHLNISKSWGSHYKSFWPKPSCHGFPPCQTQGWEDPCGSIDALLQGQLEVPKAVKLCIQHAGEVQGGQPLGEKEKDLGDKGNENGVECKMSRMQGCARDHEIVWYELIWYNIPGGFKDFIYFCRCVLLLFLRRIHFDTT